MAQELKSSLKDRLRQALIEADMKPIDLSERTGIPKSMISYYLNGKTKPKADRIYVICQVLGVSEAWLLGYDVPKNRTAEQKKNDDLVKIIAQMRQDPKFFDIVSMLAELPPEQYDSLTTIISALGKK